MKSQTLQYKELSLGRARKSKKAETQKRAFVVWEATRNLCHSHVSLNAGHLCIHYISTKCVPRLSKPCQPSDSISIPRHFGFHAMPFHSIPFHPTPFHARPCHAFAFHSIPCLSPAACVCFFVSDPPLLAHVSERHAACIVLARIADAEEHGVVESHCSRHLCS